VLAVPLLGPCSQSPSSVLPHEWGRKMLQNVSVEAACGSISFPRLRGKVGMEDSQHIPNQEIVSNQCT